MLITSASCSSAAATRSWSPGASTELARASAVNVVASAASMTAPASARPSERPNEPAAELTPAASLARSSDIGPSV